MRKILLIDGGKVTPLNETRFTEEGKLQDYLEEYPSLIPLADILEGASDLLCIGREVGAGSGSIDLLCIDKDSLLTVVETKLRRNREARREVVGQIIEYASYVSQWTADDVYRIANEYFANSEKAPQNYKGKTLEGIMEGIVQDEFSDEDFRRKIGQNLSDGRIRLVIAVDELIEPLRATVTFLNSHSNFDILLLQVTDFEESEEKKVLVPLLFGYKPPPPPPEPGTRVQSTEENFFEDARNKCNEEVVAAMEDLYKFSKAKAAFIGWGTGAARRSFIFQGVKKGLPIFILYSDGAITNYVGGTAAWQALDIEGLKGFWVSELSRRLQNNFSREWGTINIDDLVQRNKLDEFKDAVLALCQQIES